MPEFSSFLTLEASEQKADDLAALWQKFRRDKDPECRNALLMHYIGLVKRVVHRLFTTSSAYHELEDLLSCGVIGLMDAIDRFEDGQGARFETYAQIRIKGEIVDHMRRQDWAPVHLRSRLRQVQAAYESLSQQLGREPEDDQVAEALGLELSQLREMLSELHLSNIIYFDEILSDAGSRRQVESSEARIEQAYELKEMKQHLVEALKELKEREQLVLNLYYFDELTLKEIGQVLGLTESRISQIHSKALLRLRSKLGKVN